MMNDGKFSGALIKETTQIVLMDEWTPDCLNCDDAKRILQGISMERIFSFIFLGFIRCSNRQTKGNVVKVWGTILKQLKSLALNK